MSLSKVKKSEKQLPVSTIFQSEFKKRFSVYWNRDHFEFESIRFVIQTIRPPENYYTLYNMLRCYKTLEMSS